MTSVTLICQQDTKLTHVVAGEEQAVYSVALICTKAVC